jgi:hypothetical protein
MGVKITKIVPSKLQEKKYISYAFLMVFEFLAGSHVTKLFVASVVQ